MHHVPVQRALEVDLFRRSKWTYSGENVNAIGREVPKRTECSDFLAILDVNQCNQKMIENLLSSLCNQPQYSLHFFHSLHDNPVSASLLPYTFTDNQFYGKNYRRLNVIKNVVVCVMVPVLV